MLTYLISSPLEKDRLHNINTLQSQLNNVIHIKAIYPSQIHVPFLNQILDLAKQRTNRALSSAELGLLLSHREAWRSLLNSDHEAALILESDSMIQNEIILNKYFETIHKQFDLFFWGAFDGRMKIFTKGRFNLNKSFVVGNPVINSVYCTYGYSINKKTASFLLKQTSKVNYPVDFWKIRLKNTNLIIGGVSPEIISPNPQFNSTVQSKKFSIYDNKIIKQVIDWKNTILAYLNGK
jgi:GR25 family glycosyltransferase involved in LPS biosynthesis